MTLIPVAAENEMLRPNTFYRVILNPLREELQMIPSESFRRNSGHTPGAENLSLDQN